MQMEFNPIDAIIPAGNEIRIELTESGMDYLPSPCFGNPLYSMTVDIDSSSTLSLPLIDRDEETAREWFEVPNWWDTEE